MLDLSGVHYNDALLSVIFAGGFMFMGYSIHRFTKIDHLIAKLEMKMLKRINKSNEKGARKVNEKFEEVIKMLNHPGFRRDKP